MARFHRGGIKNTKTEAIRKIQPPTNKKQLRRFLGMTNYLNKFIPRYSQITHNLRALLTKEAGWVWAAEQQLDFDKLKEMLQSSPVLRYYDVSDDVVLSVDASSKALAAVLLQRNRPVAYAARALRFRLLVRNSMNTSMKRSCWWSRTTRSQFSKIR